MNPNIQISDIDGNDLRPKLIDFANRIGLEAVATGRYSILLILQLYGAVSSGTQNVATIIREISALEGIPPKSTLKPPSTFKRAPLEGLWHKHYLESGLPSMVQNLDRGLNKNGLPWLKNMVDQLQASGEERFISEEDIRFIVHDAVTSNWERLTEQSALTGEWIVYAKHEDRNYYLSLGKHGSDDALRAQIDQVCLREFPFLCN